MRDGECLAGGAVRHPLAGSTLCVDLKRPKHQQRTAPLGQRMTHSVTRQSLLLETSTAPAAPPQ